jgi:hypothetical protein
MIASNHISSKVLFHPSGKRQAKVKATVRIDESVYQAFVRWTFELGFREHRTVDRNAVIEALLKKLVRGEVKL